MQERWRISPRTVIAGIIGGVAGVAAWFIAGGPRESPGNLAVVPTSEAARPRLAAASPSAVHDSAVPPEAGSETAASIAALDARTLTLCHRQVRVRRGMEGFDCEGYDEDDVGDREVCGRYLEYVRRELPQVVAAAAPCPEALAEPSVYYRAIRELAFRGDVAAQRCFIQGYFGIDREQGLELTKREDDEYEGIAKEFIAAAFQRGDWSVVRWLSKSSVDVEDLMLARAHPLGLDDRVTAYKIHRLLVLGNQPALGALEHSDTRRLVEDWKREQWLTDDELEAAESWAREMYQQHFVGSQEGASIEIEDFCPG